MIRKVQIGVDLLNCMHFTVGQAVIGKTHVIESIVRKEDGLYIYVENDKKEIVKWKRFNNSVPITEEFSLEF